MPLHKLFIVTVALLTAPSCMAAAPLAIENLTALPDRTAKLVNFAWDENPLEDNVSHYKFYVGYAPGEWFSLDGQNIGLSTTLVNRNLDASKEYYYAFSAVNADGEGPLTEMKVSLGGERSFIRPEPNGGIFTDPVVVSFDLPDNHLLSYTLDGSDPTDPDNFASITIYTSPFKISKNATLRYFITDTASDYSQEVEDVTYVIDTSALAAAADAEFEAIEAGVSVKDAGLADQGQLGSTGGLISAMEVTTKRLSSNATNTVSVAVRDKDGKKAADSIPVTLNVLKEGARTTTTYASISENGSAVFTIPNDTLEEANYQLWTFSNGIESPRVLLKADLAGQLEETGTGMNLMLFLSFIIGVSLIYALQKRSASY